MCGLAAIFGQSQSKKKDTEKMIASIAHRGPDQQGFLHKEDISMGSCRLSIFDFSDKGNMPMSDKSGRYTIIYNGEIYNFKELKVKFNLTTKSNSDTEILLELFVKLNLDCLKLLNGIFAFIIFDNIEKKVYCARDRFGVKPLYFLNTGSSYYFCSEIKGLLNVTNNVSINYETVQMYLSSSFYDYSPQSFYKQITQVEQSTCLIFDTKKNENFFFKYWDLNETDKSIESFNSLDDHFVNSLSLQQQSDTRIGLNVSNGLDSNLMISYLNHMNGGQKKISTNSYYFSDPEFDSRNDIKEMSNYYGWNINEYEITSQDVINKFESVFNSQDEPYPGVVTIAKDTLIEKAYASDCKVILEGQGGDDIAAGYKYVFPLYILDLLIKLRIFKSYEEIKYFTQEEGLSLQQFFNFFSNSIKGYFFGGTSADGTNSYQSEILTISKNENKNLYKNILTKIKKNKTYLKKILYRDIFFTKLSRILRSCDRASMAHGKELRVPFLDHNLVKYFFSIENDKLINKGRLRNYYKNFALNKFPDNKFLKKRKLYLADPQTKWLKSSLFGWMYDKLSSNNLLIDSLIDKKKLMIYLNKFKTDTKIDNSNFLWQLISVEYLLENNKKKEYANIKKI